MTTQSILPKSVRVGDKVILETVPRDQCHDGNPREHVVKAIWKTRGLFTGATVWHFEFEVPPEAVLMHRQVIFHDKTDHLPAEKVTIRKR